MLISISSQAMGGSYQNSQWRRDEVITEWILEPPASTSWQNDLTSYGITWSDDLSRPSTNWENN